MKGLWIQLLLIRLLVGDIQVGVGWKLANIIESKQFQPSLLQSVENQLIFESFMKDCVDLQDSMINTLEVQESTAFKQDLWTRYQNPQVEGMKELAGFGNTAVIRDGRFIEKGAVSTSFLKGKLSKERAATISARNPKVNNIQEGQEYSAAALSLVLHTASPHIPTFRADIRCFQVFNKDSQNDENEDEKASNIWFGGGVDLTPYYLYEEDIAAFHATFRDLCNRYDPTLPSASTEKKQNRLLYGALYEKMKLQCDDYFFIPHRKEHRGTGGLFFDDLQSLHGYLQPDLSITATSKADINRSKEFVKTLGKEMIPTFQTICALRGDLPYTARQKEWQCIRRGRYIEFNLLYDRGVKFGLVPGGRIEAVLVSCPPVVHWKEDFILSDEERRVLEVLKRPKRW